MYRDSVYILKVPLMRKNGQSDLDSTFTVMITCSAELSDAGLAGLLLFVITLEPKVE